MCVCVCARASVCVCLPFNHTHTSILNYKYIHGGRHIHIYQILYINGILLYEFIKEIIHIYADLYVYTIYIYIYIYIIYIIYIYIL